MPLIHNTYADKGDGTKARLCHYSCQSIVASSGQVKSALSGQTKSPAIMPTKGIRPNSIEDDSVMLYTCGLYIC